MDLKRVKTVRISTSLLRWDADRGKRWWTFLTFFQITQAQWFTSWACLVTEWATGPQIGSPGGAGVFRIIAWAWGGFYLSIRWYWGWTLKSDKLLKIADMHSILFGRSWHIWLWSWHKGSSAEAPPNSTFLHSSLPYTFPPPTLKKKEDALRSLTLLSWESSLVDVLFADVPHWTFLYVLLSFVSSGF